MLVKKKKKLNFEDIFELNNNASSILRPGHNGDFMYFLKPCFFCKEQMPILVRAKCDGIQYGLYIGVYNSFIWVPMKELETNPNWYRKYKVVDYLENVMHYLMHKDCIPKYKVVP